MHRSSRSESDAAASPSVESISVTTPGFPEWDRRHAATRRERDAQGVVGRPDPPGDDLASRHCRCSRE